MKYLILILILFFFISSKTSGQVILQGKVIDANTLEPIEYASVSVLNSGFNILTDRNGRFNIKISSDFDSVEVRSIGYKIRTVFIRKKSESLVISLARGPVDLKEVTISSNSGVAGFHNISGIDLNLRPVNSAQDLMRLVPGLFLGQHQGGGIAEHIFLRGFDADHGSDVNVSVDGMPLNLPSQIHGQGFADMHFLIPELVSKYDFGKGPYYADKGDFTTAGYVAFHTLDVLEKNTVKAELGQFHTGRLMTMINLLSDKDRDKGQNAYVAGEAAYTDGPFDRPQHFNRFNLFGKYNQKLSEKTNLSVTASTFSSQWHSSGEIPERAVAEGITGRFGYIDSAQGGQTTRTNGIVKINTAFNNQFSLENEFYYSRYYFNLNYDATFFAEDSVHGDQLKQHESRNLFGYNGRLSKHSYFKNGGDLNSVWGAGWQYNRIDNSELSHTMNYNDVLEYLQLGNIRESNVNVFLDETYHIGKWLFNGGLRLDYFHFDYINALDVSQPAVSKYILSPKFNIAYTFNNEFQFYMKTGKGFHSNDAKVVTYNHGSDVLPAAYGVDLGVNWKPLPHLFINAALWYLKLAQEYIYDGDEGTFGPGGRTRREGIDLSIRYQINTWLFANVDFNYCKARSLDEPKGNDYLPLAVPLSSTGGLDFKLKNGLNGGLSYRYMKDRPANDDNTLVAKGYFVTDLTANYTRPKYEIGIEIQNLFNTEWLEAQFETESRMRNEPAPVDDISFTPGTPFFIKLKYAVFF